MFRKIASILALASVAMLTPPAESNQKGRLYELMQDKLRSSQVLLQGIATGDFAKVISSAEDLLRISRTTEWIANRSPRFEVHSNAFQRAAESLIAKAKAKNLDGTVLAYQDLTASCVRCHEYLRETRDARGPIVDPAALARR